MIDVFNDTAIGGWIPQHQGLDMKKGRGEGLEVRVLE